MAFLFGKKEESNIDIDESKYKSFLEGLNIKVMPEKFLFARNVNPDKKKEAFIYQTKPHKENVARNTQSSDSIDIKRKIVRNAIIAVVVMAVIGGAGFLFVKFGIQTPEPAAETENRQMFQTEDREQSQQPPVSEVEGEKSDDVNTEPDRAIDKDVDTEDVVSVQDQNVVDDDNNLFQSATSTPTSTVESSPSPPSLIKDEDIDVDNDLLTVEEEVLFGTDPNNSDTDNDGFPDGLEVANLFDPRFGDGARLFDSNRVKYYISNDFNFKLLIPNPWSVEEKNRLSQVIFKPTKGNDFIEVLVEENTQNFPDITSWYKSIFPEAEEDSIKYVKSQNIEGIESPDGFTTYFLTDRYVYTITYSPDFRAMDNMYYSVYRMLIRSFTIFEDPFM